MRMQIILASILGLTFAVPSLACLTTEPIPSPNELVKSAEVIVRVRVRGISPKPGVSDLAVEPPWAARYLTQVDAEVLEVLKGAFPSQTITFDGYAEDRDDPNGRPVPYHFVRPGGRAGSCVALGYRQGAEYLLLLKRIRAPSAQADLLTPYWSPLAPTNEQIFGPQDPWLGWVREELESR